MTVSDYQPSNVLISAVTNAYDANVTTVSAHGFTEGQYVLIYVPEDYGMHIPHTLTPISNVTDTTFDTEINTTQEPPYVTPTGSYTQAQAVPASGLTSNIATNSG